MTGTGRERAKRNSDRRSRTLFRSLRRRKCGARRLGAAGFGGIVARQMCDLCAKVGVVQRRDELLHVRLGQKIVAAQKEITLGHERQEVQTKAARGYFQSKTCVG